MPIILVSMNIFPNVGLDDLGFTFDENSSVYDILVNVASPHPIVLVDNIPLIGAITVQMGLYTILAILITVAVIKSTTIPVIVAGISAVLFIPFLVDTGYIFMRDAESYNSVPLVLMIVAIIVGIVALGVITLLEGAVQSQDASDT